MLRPLEFASLLERANAAVERAHYLMHRTRDLIELSTRLQNDEYLRFDMADLRSNRRQKPSRNPAPILDTSLTAQPA
jgi:hypothetical protein